MLYCSLHGGWKFKHEEIKRPEKKGIGEKPDWIIASVELWCTTTWQRAMRELIFCCLYKIHKRIESWDLRPLIYFFFALRRHVGCQVILGGGGYRLLNCTRGRSIYGASLAPLGSWRKKPGLEASMNRTACWSRQFSGPIFCACWLLTNRSRARDLHEQDGVLEEAVLRTLLLRLLALDEQIWWG